MFMSMEFCFNFYQSMYFPYSVTALYSSLVLIWISSSSVGYALAYWSSGLMFKPHMSRKSFQQQTKFHCTQLFIITLASS